VALQLPEDPAYDGVRCQTIGCNNAVAVVVTRLEDNEADMLCMSCNLAFWLRVLQQAEQNGLISLADPATTG
jgi:methanogenic corrinoid protein MtbC1